MPFPCPRTPAVDTPKIVIGDRFIEGDIKERQEARIIYEEAAANGQRAGLVGKSGRTCSPPRWPISGRARRWRSRSNTRTRRGLNGVWSTRFPLVIAPRYPKATYGLTADRTNRTLRYRSRAGSRPHHAARAASGA